MWMCGAAENEVNGSCADVRLRETACRRTDQFGEVERFAAEKRERTLCKKKVLP